MIDFYSIIKRFVAPVATCAECGAFVEPEMKDIHRAWHASIGIIRAPGSVLHSHGEPRLPSPGAP